MTNIGEVIKYKGLRLIVIEEEGCDNCYFNENEPECENAPECSKYVRPDGKPVIFKELEFKFGK